MAHEQKLRPFENDIGFYIKQQGYSIAQFAAMTEIPRRTLTAYIAGDYRVPRERLQKIAQKLRCPINILLPKPGHLSEPPPRPAPRKPRTTHMESTLPESGTLLPTSLSSEPPKAAPIILTRSPALPDQNERTDTPSEQQLGAWLALEACQLGQLLDAGWTPETILDSLRVVLQGIQGIPRITRRKLLELGAAAIVGSVPMLTGKYVTAEERMQLTEALGKSIEKGWKLFHTASTSQVFAIGHAQLYLVQQNHSVLPPHIRSQFYAAVYNLIGMAQHFQGQYDEALSTYNSAYMAALEASDSRQLINSLICQTNSQGELRRHSEAIQTIESALRLADYQSDEAHLRARAHLLACWADHAMTLGEHTVAQQQLDVSAAYLDQISPNEEFDRASWLLASGKYALLTSDYPTALQQFEAALAQLALHENLRRANALVSQGLAYVCMCERDASMSAAEKALPVLRTLNAPTINRQFHEYVLQGLVALSPHDTQVRMFVHDVLHQLRS